MQEKPNQIDFSQFCEGSLASHSGHLDADQKLAIQILGGLAQDLIGGGKSWRNIWGLMGAPVPRGLYLYGKVGRGKSMLMDLFFDYVRVDKKRRVHFYQFMLEVHHRLHRLQGAGAGDVIQTLAKEIAGQARLLCFDELFVSNIADAMILGRLFENLFAQGVVMVATSNAPPDGLYKNGLQRDRFLPFIALLKNNMVVHEMVGAVDYRYEAMRGMQTYFTPLNDETTAKLWNVFYRLTDNAKPQSMELPVDGRILTLPRTAHGVAFYDFAELCAVAVSAADYLALMQCCHALILDKVPMQGDDRLDEVVRFQMLIDTVYEAKVKLYLASAVPVDKLCANVRRVTGLDRTISRLIEMQSAPYQQQGHLSEGGN